MRNYPEIKGQLGSTYDYKKMIERQSSIVSGEVKTPKKLGKVKTKTKNVCRGGKK